MAITGIAHKNLTDPQLHEIKGASTATAGQVPVANGEGSAPFQTLSIGLLDFEPSQVPEIVPTTLPTVNTLNISALSATTTGILADAFTFDAVNKNTKENASKINSIIQAYNALKTEHISVLNKLNSLIAELEELGLLAQENE